MSSSILSSQTGTQRTLGSFLGVAFCAVLCQLRKLSLFFRQWGRGHRWAFPARAAVKVAFVLTCAHRTLHLEVSVSSMSS